MDTYLDPYKEYNEDEAKELAQKIFNELMKTNKQFVKLNDVRSAKYRESVLLTKKPLTKEELESQIYEHLAPHYGTIFLDEPFYINHYPYDETQCTISITPDLKINIALNSETYPRIAKIMRNGVSIQYCEYDEDTQELVERVGVKYSTECTISNPNKIYSTIQELMEKIKSVQN